MHRTYTRTLVLSGLAIVSIAVTIWTSGSTAGNGFEESGLFATLRAAPGQAGQPDDEEELDTKFRQFGRAAGAAYQCAPESDRERVVNDVRHAYSRVGQLFGTDRAFYFAAAFGAGTRQDIDKARCAELIKKLQESVLVRRLTK